MTASVLHTQHCEMYWGKSVRPEHTFSRAQQQRHHIDRAGAGFHQLMTGNTLVTLEERAKLTSATDFAVLIPPSLHTNFSPCAGSLREDVVQPQPM